MSFAPPQASSLTPSAEAPAKPSGPVIGQAKLANGLEIVVIPDHRSPVVTHMVWYRNGSADDPLGKSGIAHFLEHLMFKGTSTHPQGEFSQLVADSGGQENAFTSNDYTAYFQRVARDQLAVCMEYEADRMKNLVLTDEIVAPEREVVLEERRMRTDSDPSDQLNEAVQAALFTQHPYGRPIIGWNHEIESLDRSDALAYYDRFYTPENAILVVAGDVSTEEVVELAEKIYGPIPARGEPPKRERPREPEQRAHRLVTLADEKVEQPAHHGVYLVPSYHTAAPGVAEALEVLGHLLGAGHTSLLFKNLVIDQKIAVGAGAHYLGSAVDDTRFYVYAVPAEGVSLERLDAAIDEIIARVAAEGVDEADFKRAKTRLIADAVYAQDNQASLARWYGASLATGLSIEDVTQWPQRIDAVAREDVRQAARLLDKKRSVTGFLLSAPAGDEAPRDGLEAALTA
ncbi:peptidase M16 domain protein [Methylocella silvestris BL2]|uniref:Peptidase M16 domain protein n=1 Tax=Methylocella silvestris (strain DSM 15510 / CIP 108128 / LMG 27833 / NCIMB 13906 / BL2) TaxID=395965 RepID=B8ETD8_METSB|nr:pitrilysin family protein [Methylocella silvestris]ACK51780.1 peptidase M16 domain protein [Methylocella silvestris BL2]